jgi:multicomponent Na+:H+ antiporter subunit D
MIEILPALLFMTPFLAALLCSVIGWLGRGVAWWVTIVAMALTMLLALVGAHRVLTVGPMHMFMGGWRPPLGIEWVLDPLAVLGTLLVSGVSLVVLWGARETVSAEMPGRELYFYSCSLLLVSGLLGMVVTGDLFNLFVFVEVASLSAYALVAAGGRGSAQAAFRYLIIGSLGATLYLVGVGFLFAATGSLNMQDVGRLLASGEPRLASIALILIVAGLAVKMGLFPLHSWMAPAYSRTSAASAALMAPLVTKVAAYALIRVLLRVYGLEYLREEGHVLLLLSWAGALAMIAGAALALLQQDLRRLLAYSSVSQVGLIALGFGLANASAMTGAMLHLVNDALMKGTLFLAAALALLRFGVSKVDDLNQLRGRAPLTTAAMSVAALSLVGIPPLSGFFGKWYVLAGALDAHQWPLAAAVVMSTVLTGVYAFRIIDRLFFSGATALSRTPREGSVALVAACSLLATAIILVGVGNHRLVGWIIRPILGME